MLLYTRTYVWILLYHAQLYASISNCSISECLLAAKALYFIKETCGLWI